MESARSVRCYRCIYTVLEAISNRACKLVATGSVSNDDRGVNEDGKKSSSIRLAKQHHESRFLVHFFVATARLRHDNT